MNFINIKIAALIIILLAFSSTVAQYDIAKSVFGSGGESMQNSSYKINATIGESVIGFNSNSTSKNEIGFWYQVNTIVTAIEQGSDKLPKKFILEQNYPNPFNPTTTIEYTIPAIVKTQNIASQQPKVTLKIYNILGKEVAMLVNKKQKPGVYKVTFNAKDLSSGVYLYQLRVGNFVQCKKLTLLK